MYLLKSAAEKMPPPPSISKTGSILPANFWEKQEAKSKEQILEK